MRAITSGGKSSLLRHSPSTRVAFSYDKFRKEKQNLRRFGNDGNCIKCVNQRQKRPHLVAR